MKAINFKLVGILLVFSLAIGTGGFVLGASFAIANSGDPWLWGIIGCAIGYAGTLLIGFAWWRSLMDPPVTQPGAGQPGQTRINYIQHEANAPYAWGVFVDLPLTQEQLEAFATMLTRDPSLTHARFAGARKLLMRSIYELTLDKLIMSGLARWNNAHAHQQGAALTHSGRALMRRIAEQAASTRTHMHIRERIQ
jgi:hypothetical protein